MNREICTRSCSRKIVGLSSSRHTDNVKFSSNPRGKSRGRTCGGHANGEENFIYLNLPLPDQNRGEMKNSVAGTERFRREVSTHLAVLGYIRVLIQLKV